MKLTITSGYFGDPDSLLRFVEGLIGEIDYIDQRGREHSHEPQRFLSDCHPSFSTLRMILKQFQTKVETAKESVDFSTGED
jgi:hypothetical protein